MPSLNGKAHLGIVYRKDRSEARSTANRLTDSGQALPYSAVKWSTNLATIKTTLGLFQLRSSSFGASFRLA
jgi:hypothetical protein